MFDILGLFANIIYILEVFVISKTDKGNMTLVVIVKYIFIFKFLRILKQDIFCDYVLYSAEN